MLKRWCFLFLAFFWEPMVLAAEPISLDKCAQYAREFEEGQDFEQGELIGGLLSHGPHGESEHEGEDEDESEDVDVASVQDAQGTVAEVVRDWLDLFEPRFRQIFDRKISVRGWTPVRSTLALIAYYLSHLSENYSYLYKAERLTTILHDRFSFEPRIEELHESFKLLDKVIKWANLNSININVRQDVACEMHHKHVEVKLYELAQELQSQGRIEAVDALYKILDRYDHFDRARRLAGLMFVSTYNKLVRRSPSTTRAPTKAQFELIQKARQRFKGVDHEVDESTFYVAREVERLHDEFIIWYMSRRDLEIKLGDDYMERVRTIFTDYQAMVADLRQSTTYGLQHPNDLLYKLLTKWRFVPVYWKHQNKLAQYFWVHYSGIQVRIKPGHKVVTIALTRTNPLTYDHIKKSFSLTRDKHGHLVIDHPQNEVLKWADDGTLIPAFNDDDFQWNLHHVTTSTRNRLQEKAHSHLDPSHSPGLRYKNASALAKKIGLLRL